MQRAGERQRVEEDQLLDARQAGGQPAEHRDVERVAVVRHQQIVAHELAERGPDVGEGRLIAHVGVAIAVHGRGPRRDRAATVRTRR